MKYMYDYLHADPTNIHDINYICLDKIYKKPFIFIFVTSNFILKDDSVAVVVQLSEQVQKKFVK